MFETRHPASLSLDDWQRNQIETHAAREYAVSVLPATINTRANDILRGGLKSLTFLIDDDTVVFHVTDVKQDKRRKIISGYTNTSDVDGLLAYDPAEKTLAGSFVHDGDPVLIEPIGEGISSVFRMDGPMIAEWAANTSSAASLEPHATETGNKPLSRDKLQDSPSACTLGSGGGPTVIRVMEVEVFDVAFGKSPSSKRGSDPTIGPLCYSDIYTNQALSNSGFDVWRDVRFECAGRIGISRPDVYDPRLDSDINRVITDPDVNLFGDPDVRAYREQTGADLVVFLIDFPIGNKDFGVTDIDPAQPNAVNPYTLTLTDVAFLAGYWTATHELGHLIGGYHEKRDQNGNVVEDCQTKPDSEPPAHCSTVAHGYVTKDGQGRTINTVLATGKIDPGFGYITRRLMFSNPKVNFPNTSIPAGVLVEADMARVITCNAATVAGFRSDGSSFVYNRKPGSKSQTDSRSVPEGTALYNIYPNPASGHGTNVLFNNAEELLGFDVFDLLGRKVHTEPVRPGQVGRRIHLATNDLSPGIYLIRASFTGHTQTGTLIVKQ